MVNINLLPIDQRKRLVGQKPTGPFILSFIFIFIATSVFYYFLLKNITLQSREESLIEAEIKTKQKELAEYQDIEKSIQNNRTIYKEIEKINENASNIMKVYELLSQSMPSDMTISGLNLAKARTGNIQFSAKTSSVRTASLFKEKLDQSEWVSDLSFSSITIGEDGSTSFSISLTAKNLIDI